MAGKQAAGALDIAEALGLERTVLSVAGREIQVRHLDELTLAEQARFRRLSKQRKSLIASAAAAEDPKASDKAIEAAEKALGDVEALTRTMVELCAEGETDALGSGGANFVIAHFLERTRSAEQKMVKQLKAAAPTVMAAGPKLVEKAKSSGPSAKSGSAASSLPSTPAGRRTTGSRGRRTA